MSDEEAYFIWWYEQKSGPFNLYRLRKMVEGGDITPQTPFWSERRHEWLPLAGIIFESSPDETRLADMRAAGVKAVRLLDSGTGEECPACAAISGKVFPIDDPPTLPPDGCSCKPWCRCCLIAAKL